MSSDFWAGYLSGAAGIMIGNPLDIIKVRLQAGSATHIAQVPGERPRKLGSLVRGVTAPVLGYGALNALLFVSYNRSLMLLDPQVSDPTMLPATTGLLSIWVAGAVGGLATWVVSAPTELVKCRVQVGGDGTGSWIVAKELWKGGGLKGMYLGGGVTSLRDAIGYGFYFWSYELSKRYMTFQDESERQTALSVLLRGGLAGVVTWASIFPLDVVKTRLQTQTEGKLSTERQPLVGLEESARREPGGRSSGALEIAKQAYRQEGPGVFFRGLGVCSVRAFIVNAVQWAVYEWIMRALKA